jgi:hypothetical protein
MNRAPCFHGDMKAGHAGSTPPQGVLSEAALPERLARIDLNLLVAFDALAREQNVTRAAERVGVTQSAMSHALRRLRELLDDPLLVRGKSGMVLTARAEALVLPLRSGLVSVDRALVRAERFDPRTATTRSTPGARSRSASSSSGIASRSNRPRSTRVCRTPWRRAKSICVSRRASTTSRAERPSSTAPGSCGASCFGTTSAASAAPMAVVIGVYFMCRHLWFERVAALGEPGLSFGWGLGCIIAVLMSGTLFTTLLGDRFRAAAAARGES